MANKNALLLTLALAATPGPGTAQVPPPPPPNGQGDIGTKLFESIRRKDGDLYASLLSEDVTVTEDGRTIASDKKQWLAIFLPRLSAKGVLLRMTQGYQGSGRILTVEYFNSAGSWGTIPRDCCWSYDAVAYDIVGGRIRAIRRLRGGDVRLDEHGAVVR